MTIVEFLLMLTFFAALTSLVTEGIKNTFQIKKKYYNIVALIVALVVGLIGTLVYYQLNSMPFTVNNIIEAILMGLASGLTSMVGYDKVHDVIKLLKGV